jgi:hypothetical protein
MDIKTIRIDHGTKPSVERLVIGDEFFAIHPNGISWDEDNDGGPVFIVTHVPTGFALGFAYSWREALETIREAESRGIDWAFTDPKAAKSLKAAWEDIKATVKRRIEEDKAVTA